MDDQPKPLSIADIARELNCSRHSAKALVQSSEMNFRREFRNRLLGYGVNPESYLEEVFDTVFTKGSSLSMLEDEQ